MGIMMARRRIKNKKRAKTEKKQEEVKINSTEEVKKPGRPKKDK